MLGSGNKRLKGRDWTDYDVKSSKDMLKKIDEILRHKEQLKRLEEYVGGRPKTVNFHTFMTSKYFIEYTLIEVQQFHDTLIQHMESVTKSIDERALHKREYDNRIRDDTDIDDTDIKLVYDEEPMVEVQLTVECNIFATEQQHVKQPEFSNEGECASEEASIEMFKDPKISGTTAINMERLLMFTSQGNSQSEFNTYEACLKLQSNKEMSWYFTLLKHLHHSFVLDERVAWIEIGGLPLNAWTPKAFKKIADSWGTPLFVDDDPKETVSTGRVCIKTKIHGQVNDYCKVVVLGKSYNVYVKEFAGWAPDIKATDSISCSNSEMGNSDKHEDNLNDNDLLDKEEGEIPNNNVNEEEEYVKNTQWTDRDTNSGKEQDNFPTEHLHSPKDKIEAQKEDSNSISKPPGFEAYNSNGKPFSSDGNHQSSKQPSHFSSAPVKSSRIKLSWDLYYTYINLTSAYTRYHAPRCNKYKKIGHLARDCRSSGPNGNNNNRGNFGTTQKARGAERERAREASLFGGAARGVSYNMTGRASAAWRESRETRLETYQSSRFSCREFPEDLPGPTPDSTKGIPIALRPWCFTCTRVTLTISSFRNEKFDISLLSSISLELDVRVISEVSLSPELNKLTVEEAVTLLRRDDCLINYKVKV
ncbi:RNA-directed DNA polymerase, eukaryota [Tanacetum coccineum]